METDDASDNWIIEYRKIALPMAHKLDARSAPRRLGPLYDPAHTGHRHEYFDDVTTENDL